MKVVGNVGMVADCVPAAAALNPDVVLLDFRLPDGSGPDAAAAIRSIRPAAKMIFLTREDTDAARFAAVPAGARALLPKSRGGGEGGGAHPALGRRRGPHNPTPPRRRPHKRRHLCTH